MIKDRADNDLITLSLTERPIIQKPQLLVAIYTCRLGYYLYLFEGAWENEYAL